MVCKEEWLIDLDKEILEILESIIMCRPAPIRKYDQIYMKANDMFYQAMLVSDLIAEQKVVFLGDGDAMSLLFLLLMNKGKISYSKQLTVLDFDERIVNNHKKQFLANGINKNINLSTKLYNVINPLPEEEKNKYDFFYINPPYGSKNEARSCMAWLYRCMELCNKGCKGCIILPYDNKQVWTIENLKVIENFLIENGFIIRDIISNMHKYHLLDNPNLTSSSIIVERIENIKSKYENVTLPEEIVRNFYGNERKLPEYIKDDGTLYGVEDFAWKYGEGMF